MISRHDFRFALRSLAKVPGFTIAVITTLALGIGANTAIYSMVRGALLRPLPNRDGERLVYLRQSAGIAGHTNLLFSVPEIVDCRTGATRLRGFAEYAEILATLRAKDEPVRVTAGVTTGNYFDVMGLAPIAGRLFDSRDDGPSAARAMVLTQAYWIRHFDRARDIIGKTINFDGAPSLIVGVVEDAPRAQPADREVCIGDPALEHRSLLVHSSHVPFRAGSRAASARAVGEQHRHVRPRGTKEGLDGPVSMPNAKRQWTARIVL